MGFKGVVLSEHGHYEEYVCAICQHLVDLDLGVQTSCSHVFCSVCLTNWLERKKTCPTCQRDLSYVSTSQLNYLKDGSLLAWRVLSRVKVECPLKCGWSGDYSELQPHLLSTDAHDSFDAKVHYCAEGPSSFLENSSIFTVSESTKLKEAKKVADIFRQQAFDKFCSLNYKDALMLYSKAIETYLQTVTKNKKIKLNEPSSPVILSYQETTSKTLIHSPKHTIHSSLNDFTQEQLRLEPSKDSMLSDLFLERCYVYYAIGSPYEALGDVVSSLAHDKENIRTWVQASNLLLYVGRICFCYSLLTHLPSIMVSSSKQISVIVQEVSALKDHLTFLRQTVLDNASLYSTYIDQDKELMNRIVHTARYLSHKSQGLNTLILEARSEIEFGSLSRGTKLAFSALKRKLEEKVVPDNFSLVAERCSTELGYKNGVDQSDFVNELEVYICLALAHLYDEKFDDAMKFVKQCLLLDPEYKLAKATFRKIKFYRGGITTADKFAASREYGHAVETLTEMIVLNISDTESSGSSSGESSSTNRAIQGIGGQRQTSSPQDVSALPSTATSSGSFSSSTSSNPTATTHLSPSSLTGRHRGNSLISSNHSGNSTRLSVQSQNIKSEERIRYDTPLLASVLAERAALYLQLKNYEAAKRDCGHAIYIQEDSRRAWLTKTYVHHELGEFKKALEELEPVMERWGGNDIVLKNVYEKTKFLLRKSQRPDYYAILSSPQKNVILSAISSEMEVRNAYKKKALEVHPDRFHKKNASTEEIKMAQEAFKIVGEAFETLTDIQKRALYDEGYDKEGIEEQLKRQRSNHQQ